MAKGRGKVRRDHFVYGLFRPGPPGHLDKARLFYVGISCNPERPQMHVLRRKMSKSLKNDVICKIVDEQGYSTVPFTIFKSGLTRQEASKLEIELIASLGRHPHGPLTNVMKGGEGFAAIDLRWYTDGVNAKMFLPGAEPIGWTYGRVNASPDAVERMAALKRGKALTEEHKRKIGSAHRGQKRGSFNASWWSSPEGKAHNKKIWITDDVTETKIVPDASIPDGWRRGRLAGKCGGRNKGVPMMEAAKAHLSERNKGTLISEETKAKISAAGKGRQVSATTRAKISKAHQGKIVSAETLARMSAANKGKTLSEETKRKVGAAGKGRQVSPETRDKISRGHLARHQARREAH